MSKGRFAARHVVALACVLLSGALAACDDNQETPTTPTANARLITRDLRVGTGNDARNGDVLTVHYTGWLHDPTKADEKGLQFESSVGHEPFKFVLGAGEVIPGWDQGIVGMKPGGLRRLIIPPSLAYGGYRNGPIPPYATLVFEIELLDVPLEAQGTAYTISLRTDNGSFLSVANNGNAEVLANKTTIGPWETFRLYDVNEGSLVSGDTVRIETSSGWGFGYTSSNTLAATANPGQNFAQEQFAIELVGGTALGNGSRIALRALGTSFYVSAEGGGGGAVTVRRPSIDSWETFTLIVH